MATIKEVAALAGVSRGTVDRVLNNRGTVHPETEKRVLEAAQALHYTPNRLGKALANSRRKIKLGVVIPGEDNVFFDEVIQGIRARESAMADYGVTILLKRLKGYSAGSQIQALEALEEEGIQGLALVPINDPAVGERLNTFVDAGIPVVTLNSDIGETGRLCYVGSHYYQSGETAGGLMGMITGGRCRVGIVSGSLDVLCHSQRIAGFGQVIGSRFPDIRVLETVFSNDDEFESYYGTKRMLEEHEDMDALYLSAGGVFGACRAVLDMGRESRVKIICYDAVPTTRDMLECGVIAATICQQPKKQGSKPIDILFDYLVDGIHPERDCYYTATEIKIRENLQSPEEDGPPLEE